MSIAASSISSLATGPWFCRTWTREMQQCIGGLDRRLAAPIEHEVSSHRHLGSGEIIVVLGCQSAR
jgi:hypothetical protein